MSYKLREPQRIVFDKIRESISNGHRKILVSAPTGFGKTILAFEIAKNAISKSNRVLFTSHRIQLAAQTREKFSALNPAYLQGSSDGYNESSMLLVATLQTLINREIPNPKIVIIDEVHYGYESKLVQSLFERFHDAVFIALSATPVDDRGYLLEGFDCIIDDYQTGDLIQLGWLTPFEVYSPVTPDLSNVSISGNDYKADELETAVNKIDITNSIVSNYIAHGQGRKFICFAVNQKHALELDSAFNLARVNVRTIKADTSETERIRILSDYKDGRIQGLINIEILTAGFDDTTIGCVILACPTKSWKKFIQCCGRGIRLNGQSIEESILNGKENCILLDCAGAIAEHGLPDTRRSFIFGKKISRVIDRQLDIDDNLENRKNLVLSDEKKVYLKRIGSLLDLYDGKQYRVEAELQDDVNSFLQKTDFFWWRQNSGKMYKDGRWIHFASKSGLPDNSVFFRNSTLFFGIELKLPTGRLTDHQKQTLPEMTQRGVLFFIAESVFDVYESIEWVEAHIRDTDTGVEILKSIYDLYPRQVDLRKRLKIPFYS